MKKITFIAAAFVAAFITGCGVGTETESETAQADETATVQGALTACRTPGVYRWVSTNTCCPGRASVKQVQQYCVDGYWYSTGASRCAGNAC